MAIDRSDKAASKEARSGHAAMVNRGSWAERRKLNGLGRLMAGRRAQRESKW